MARRIVSETLMCSSAARSSRSRFSYFEQVSGPVGTEDESRVGSVAISSTHHGVAYGVRSVLQFDAVAERSPEGIHRGNVLQNRQHADAPTVKVQAFTSSPSSQSSAASPSLFCSP